MAHKNKTEKYPVDATCQNASCLLLRPKSRLEKHAISAALNKTFCPAVPPCILQRLKHHQRTKINKTMLFASPLSVLTEKEMSVQCSILTVIELRLPVSEPSTEFQNFMAPTDSEHKFHKMGITRLLKIQFGLFLIRNPQSQPLRYDQ